MTHPKTKCGIEPIDDFILVADYGQPDRSKGGIIVPDSAEEFWRYRNSEWRFGEVIAIGPGRPHRRTGNVVPMPDIDLGDVIVFSRKHGRKLPGELRYKHEEYGELLIRTLDPAKVQLVVTGFDPWWNVQESQVDPTHQFSS